MKELLAGATADPEQPLSALPLLTPGERLQLAAWLRRWAAGDFETGEPPKPRERIEDYELPEQPHLLDRAPLEDCLGGPFHPGIELTWTLRVPGMWQPSDPRDPRSLSYRLKILDGSPRDDYGPELTGEEATGPGGPADGSGPGSLTRWMGVPGRPTRRAAWQDMTSPPISRFRRSGPRASPTRC